MAAPPPSAAAAPLGQPDPMLLLALARDNKCSELTAALAGGAAAHVNAGNRMGQTALHVAALWGNADAIRVLVAHGANVNQPNARGTTPLHFAAAAKKDALAVCRLLLASGADPHQPDFHGYMPYEQAEQPEVRLLLGGPDQRLFDFVEQGRVDELQQLLASGEVNSLKVVDSEGCHVLNLAIQHKQPAVVQLLLATDPELAVLPDMTGNTPLHRACEVGDAALVAQLLAAQPQLNMQNLNMCDYSTGNWLIQGEGDEPIMPLDKTPLHLAVEAGAAGIVTALLAAGAKPDVLDYDGAAPLHLAVELQDEDVLAALLAGGADANKRGKDTTSALHATAQRGPLALLQLLLAHKADVAAANPQGWTPLMLAARAGSAPRVQALLDAGAQHSAVNAQGNTALHLAAVNGHAEVAKLLLAASADRTAANKEGRSAADMAKIPALAALLQQQGAS